MMLARFVGAVTLTAAVLVGAGCLSVDSQDDSQPPTVRFITPQNGATVSGVLEIEIEATDDTGIIVVRLFRNNVLAGATQLSPYKFTWDTGGFTNGEYVLGAQSVDLVGNQALAEITVTVANSGKGGVPLPD
ncbi:MAG TPA: Ig-like domain-containing protein [Gemmatimonadales bacterium]|nr:Ig-like domain-containing protein [Gemmatimonadales bacterium]